MLDAYGIIKPQNPIAHNGVKNPEKLPTPQSLSGKPFKPNGPLILRPSSMPASSSSLPFVGSDPVSI
jgi:hypothetical protein